MRLWWCIKSVDRHRHYDAAFIHSSIRQIDDLAIKCTMLFWRRAIGARVWLFGNRWYMYLYRTRLSTNRYATSMEIWYHVSAGWCYWYMPCVITMFIDMGKCKYMMIHVTCQPDTIPATFSNQWFWLGWRWLCDVMTLTLSLCTYRPSHAIRSYYLLEGRVGEGGLLYSGRYSVWRLLEVPWMEGMPCCFRWKCSEPCTVTYCTYLPATTCGWLRLTDGGMRWCCTHVQLYAPPYRCCRYMTTT